LQNNAHDKAQAEVVALAGVLPPNSALHLQAAQLFAQAQDYANALTQYEEALLLDHGNASAFAGAGSAAYRMGPYRTARRYQYEAVSLNPQDTNSRQLLESADLILQADPFRRASPISNAIVASPQLSPRPNSVSSPVPRAAESSWNPSLSTTIPGTLHQILQQPRKAMNPMTASSSHPAVTIDDKDSR
jgi:tetratricopeptide (TPR) repeat protein